MFLPCMSSETGILRISPVNSQVVCLASIPEVPSNTCTTAQSYSLAGTNRETLQIADVGEWPACMHRDARVCMPTWTTALDPLTSNTCPLRFEPSDSVRLTISANLGNWGRGKRDVTAPGTQLGCYWPKGWHCVGVHLAHSVDQKGNIHHTIPILCSESSLCL